MDKILQALQEASQAEAETELFDALEEVFYGSARKRNEKFGGFALRNQNAMRELTVAGIELPEEVKGFIMLRKAGAEQQRKDRHPHACWQQSEAQRHQEGVQEVLRRVPS